MADIFYGTARGDTTAPHVTVDTSTTSLGIELRVLEGASITKKDILLGLERIRQMILIDETRSDF